MSLIKITKGKSSSVIYIKHYERKLTFIIKKNLENYIYNILSTLAVLSLYFDLAKLDKYLFIDHQFPEGRGDLNIINLIE